MYKICRCSNDSRDYSFATLENINVPYTIEIVCYCINLDYVIHGNDCGYLSNDICWGQLTSSLYIIEIFSIIPGIT